MQRLLTMLSVAVLAAAVPAQGATFTVTTTSDTADGACDGDCSLREAVLAANALAGADTIAVPEGVFALTIPGSEENGGLTGDLDITDDVVIAGLGVGRTVVRGSGADRVFNVVHGTVQIADLTITGGGGVQFGAGVYAHGSTHLHVAHAAFIGNVAVSNGYGGAIAASSGLVVADCLFAGNRSGQFGGAIISQGSLEIVRSTFVGNGTEIGGGAVYTWGGTIDDSLFAANAANGGGAIYCHSGDTTLTNVTLTANRGVASGPGAAFAESGTLALRNCTLAANTGGSGAALGSKTGIHPTLENTIVAGPGAWADCGGGGVVSAGHNLDVRDTCDFADATDLTGLAAGLRPLRDNGGPNASHALLDGSPAVDAGGGNAAATDQRGTARPQGAAADIGAYEADGSEPPVGLPHVVPVIAHLAGVGGTPWRSDLAATNPSDQATSLSLRYTPASGTPVAKTVPLAARATVLLEDLVATLFGQGDGRGGLEVVPPASGPVPAMLSRTYAVAGAQRLGQGMPAVDPLPQAMYYIPGLREDDDYRSNVGITAGDADLTVQIDLFRGSDGSVGSTFARTVTARTQQQWRLPEMFPGLAAAGVPMTARVRIFGAAAPYGSLVDQASTDAVTLVAQGAGPVWTIPVIAHNQGGASTFWRSDLFLHNPNPVEARVDLEYFPENRDNGGGGLAATPLSIPPYGTVTVADVAGALFGVTNGKGALALVAAPSIVASSRTYTTRAAGGTYGLGVAAVPPYAFNGNTKVVTGVRVGGGYRTNLGFVSGSKYTNAITLTLRGADGAVLATTATPLKDRSLLQKSVQELFAIDWSGFTVGSVEVPATGQPLLVYTSVVDGSSQDPIYAVAPSFL